MEKSPAQYDEAYALLGLQPGQTMQDIKRARRIKVKLHHPDPKWHRPDFDVKNHDDRLKLINCAYDDLKEYWEQHGVAPPSEKRAADEAKAKTEREREQRQVAEALKREAERRRKEEEERIRRASMPLTAPLVAKSFGHDIIDWAESSGRGGWVAAAAFGAIALTGNLLLTGTLFGLFAPQGGDGPDLLRNWTNFLLLALETYVLVYGFSGFYRFYKLDAARMTRVAPAGENDLLAKVALVLSRHAPPGAFWTQQAVTEHFDDATRSMKARLAFRDKIHALVDIDYEIDFAIKFKPGVEPAHTAFVFWFEARASRPWWPPVYKFVSRLSDDLNQSLAKPA